MPFDSQDIRQLAHSSESVALTGQRTRGLLREAPPDEMGHQT
ncbi:hypothetical protein [Maioricimonas rarisocia]|nr:hypothetical protein [Maioricimonas rarisocia]